MEICNLYSTLISHSEIIIFSFADVGHYCERFTKLHPTFCSILKCQESCTRIEDAGNSNRTNLFSVLWVMKYPHHKLGFNTTISPFAICVKKFHDVH